jgi:hypothetical protein
MSQLLNFLLCLDDPQNPRAWPARDREGREVFIKLVICVASISLSLTWYRAVSALHETPELQTLKRLQSDDLRNDPRNHTIPILEWIEAFGTTFIVMPR